MWTDIGRVDEVTKLKKVVVSAADGTEIVVISHDGQFYALRNRCIHKQRELVKGVVLNGKLVCPGHQWAFELRSGWEPVKEQCQPTYPVRVHDDVVQVDTTTARAARVPCVVEPDDAGLVRD